MPSCALDTSVIVAALLGWHEHHEACRNAVEQAMDDGPVLLPAAALVESYAVMTRLPAPHRLSPRDAHALLEGSFSKVARVVALKAEDCWDLLAKLAGDGVAGGRTYDAQILAAASKGGARELLTLNLEDFETLAGESLAVRSPAATP